MILWSVLIPGNWYPKRWPKENFSLLADSLIRECGMKAIFSGSPGDVSPVDEIRAKMKEKPVIAAGKTTLKQSAAIFKKVNLVISADSGPLHIAAAMGGECDCFVRASRMRQLPGPRGKGRVVIIQKQVDCRIPCYDR